MLTLGKLSKIGLIKKQVNSMDSKYKDFYTSNKTYMVITAVLIAAMIMYGHYVVGFIAMVIFFILLAYNIKNSRLKKDEWMKFVESFSSNLDSATRSTLVNLPFPLIIVSQTGDILWYNQSISDIVGENILGNDISAIIGDNILMGLLKGEIRNYEYIEVNNRYYDIHSSLINTYENKNEEIMLLYFYDVTDKYNLEQEIANLEWSVFLVEVDNLDEVVKSTPEDKKPLLIAEVERRINSYAQNLNAMFRKYATGKYVLVVQNKKLNSEIEKKFEILDQIREIDTDNKLTVTLSIGIGGGGKNPIDNYNQAVVAKELALGRGGDQVVIKNKEKLLFYGGKTKEVEKRTKVRARVIGQSLVELVRESSNIFIMGHVNPDIDCIGAGIGLYSVLNDINDNCHIVLDSANNSVTYIVNKIKSSYEKYKNAFIESKECLQFINENTLLILDDVNSRSYVLSEEVLDKVKRVVIIDHHRRSVNYIENTILSYVEPYASSTSELVTEMIQYMDEDYNIKPLEAEALLAGICVDTKNFYFKTGVRTFEAAAFLRKNGADTIDVKKLFSSDLESYIKKSQIIESAKIIYDKVAIAICPKDIEDNIVAAQAADELLNISGIQASFVLVKIKDNVLISGRSFGDINVQIILERLGGGGHITMAGAKVEGASVDEVLAHLNEAIDKYLKEGE